jgi:ribosomal protein S19
MIKGIDLVAITCVVAFSLLIYTGHDSMLVSLLATIVGWYFGRASKTKKEEE